jgi:hypothetical protein
MIKGFGRMVLSHPLEGGRVQPGEEQVAGDGGLDAPALAQAVFVQSGSESSGAFKWATIRLDLSGPLSESLTGKR